MRRDLRERLLSVLVVLPVVLFLIWLHPWTCAGMLAAAAFLGGVESSRLLGQAGWTAPRFLPAAAVAVLAAALFAGPAWPVDLLTAICWVVPLAWLFLPGRRQGDASAPAAPPDAGRPEAARRRGGWLAHACAAIALGVLLACLGRLVGGPWPGRVGPTGSSQLLLYALAIVWSCDTGAYLVGSRLGRHKLWPAVSPGKTWEGAVGGTVAASLAALFLAAPLAPGLGRTHALILGGAGAVAAQLGDLFESRLKRLAGVKDSGAFMRGHGGILDRIDSLLFAGPVLAYGLSLLLR